jgi:hypothetical protein
MIICTAARPHAGATSIIPSTPSKQRFLIPDPSYLDQAAQTANLDSVKLLERLDRACRLAHFAKSDTDKVTGHG